MDLLHSDEIASAIRTRHLLTPMSRVVSYPTDVSCAAVADFLGTEGFDTAPVTRDGQICGYVRRAEVVQGQGCVEPYVRTITANTVVSGIPRSPP